VVGIDTDAYRCAAVGEGESYVEDVASTDLRRARERGRLTAATAVSAAGDLDDVDICVHTPLGNTT
jgi:UDP-N-acetyl-D-glucosamine dehydrogenase